MEKYTSINNLNSVDEILIHECVVMEKLHGTNVRFGRDTEGNELVGSRNNIISTRSEDGTEFTYNKEFDSYGFQSWVNEHVDFSAIPYDTYFYGEWFGTGIQKGIKYFDTIKKEFACFDMKKNGQFANFEDMALQCRVLGYATVPVLFTGRTNIEDLTILINADSKWATDNASGGIGEGVVIKPIKETRDHRGNRIIAKFKNDKFTEKSRGPKVPKKKSPSWALGSAYCTEARVDNTIDKLRQTTDEPITMRNMGEILKLFSLDVIKDADNFPIDRNDQRDFMKGATSGVSKLVKEWLIKPLL